MSFSIVYVGGGVLDKVRSVSRLEGGRLDAPFMPTLTEPAILGYRLEVPASFDTATYATRTVSNGELLSVAVACDKYQDRDCWSLEVNGQMLVEKVYTKQLPEGLNFMVAKFTGPGTEIKFHFHNEGGAAKTVWFNLQFLRGAA